MKVVNASGHPIVADQLEVVKVVPPPHINPSWTDGVLETARQMAKEAAPYVRDGAAIALPGLSYLAAAFLAALHREVGKFPPIIWSVRPEGESRYIWDPKFSIDLEEV